MKPEITSRKKDALTAFNRKDFSNAVTAFLDCVRLLENENSPLDLAEMKNNLSVAYLQAKNYQGALNAALGTDLVFKQLGDKKRQAVAVANIASALESLKRFDEALPLFESSCEIFKEIGENEMRAYNLRRIAEIQRVTGQTLQAYASLEASFEQTENGRPVAGFIRRVLTKIRQFLFKS